MVDTVSPPELADVLADVRGEAAVLRRAGNVGQADYLEALCERIKNASEDFMKWLEEPDALLRSGWSERTFRRRFGEMLDCGLARWREGARQVRLCAVPLRANVVEQRARGAAS